MAVDSAQSSGLLVDTKSYLIDWASLEKGASRIRCTFTDDGHWQVRSRAATDDRDAVTGSVGRIHVAKASMLGCGGASLGAPTSAVVYIPPASRLVKTHVETNPLYYIHVYTSSY